MADQLFRLHWSETDLEELGVPITPAFINDVLINYRDSFANGLVGHTKVYVPFHKDALAWMEGALVGFFGKYFGAKDIHFAPANSKIGKQLQHIDIFFRNKFSGEHLMSLEGTMISNGKTGWFALVRVNLLLRGKHDIHIFLFGAGRVAEAFMLALEHGVDTRIKHIAVLSRGGKSNHELVEKLKSKVQFQLDVITTKFVITATNADKPIFETDETVNLPYLALLTSLR